MVRDGETPLSAWRARCSAIWSPAGPHDRAPVSNRGLVVPVDGRRMISTGVGITLVVAGAILRFAVPTTLTYGLNSRVVSVIVMLAGVFGLLLSLLVRGPLARRRNHDGG